ncbi:hypothetical protein OH76DRAFT_245363 [Lentinus brumalis]|uniref:Uncharacterized protein n=1 Tax=Lentinus brumalis TaxID=2498619 RepID=A0A371CLV6_9APHY|nr:hypothetical protein OH76DRAFT_245363 [Polyporus brumalis]
MILRTVCFVLQSSRSSPLSELIAGVPTFSILGLAAVSPSTQNLTVALRNSHPRAIPLCPPLLRALCIHLLLRILSAPVGTSIVLSAVS